MKEKYADVKSSMRDGLSSVAKQLDDWRNWEGDWRLG
jgi:hypothetical protein